MNALMPHSGCPSNNKGSSDALGWPFTQTCSHHSAFFLLGSISQMGIAVSGSQREETPLHSFECFTCQTDSKQWQTGKGASPQHIGIFEMLLARR